MFAGWSEKSLDVRWIFSGSLDSRRMLGGCSVDARSTFVRCSKDLQRFVGFPLDVGEMFIRCSFDFRCIFDRYSEARWNSVGCWGGDVR